MLPEIGAYISGERKFSAASLKSIAIVEHLGPRVPLLPRRRFDFFGGHHSLDVQHGNHHIQVAYDEVAQTMKASIITYAHRGKVLQKRKYKANNGGQFSLKVETPYIGGTLEELHKVGSFRFTTHLHHDTLFELETLEEILNETLPK